MNIAVTGSLAYDRIMDFNDRFRNHIIPDKIHMLSVSFVLERLEEKFGGTAGNIAYSLKLLGMDPAIIGSVGKDFGRYGEYLKGLGIGTSHIKAHEDEYTAVATMITDLDDNQISAFYPGALSRGHELDIPRQFGRDDFLVVAPSSKQEITKRCTEAHKRQIPYLFDPGQQMTVLSGEELLYGAEKAAIAIFNDYEWQLFREKTGMELGDLASKSTVVIVTQGREGSAIHAKDLAQDLEIGIAKPREVVDPTGAGDAFRAGIIAGFVNEWSWKETGQVAATIASFAVEKYGTQEHAPSAAEINERYKKNFNAESPLTR
ncbi:MAG: carbohydrate kinase family protein [Parcubacteria group bacterium]|nr:carbohydrate kinase family protein [Parcubacteria group bacterium]